MTDEEAKTRIVDALTSRPVTVDMVSGVAASVLAEDQNRLFAFNQWLETNGATFCAAMNK